MTKLLGKTGLSPTCRTFLAFISKVESTLCFQSLTIMTFPMKKLLFLVLIVCVSMFSACDKNECDCSLEGTYNLTFKATYGGETLVKYKDYNYGDTTFPVLFSRFRTYISDLALIKADGTTYPLKDVVEVDFFPDNATTETALTPSFDLGEVPAGEYTGIRYGLGVRPDLNAKRPNDYENGHPLKNEIEYWQSWKSYIFTKIEGQADKDNNGSDDIYFQYHTGADPVYKTFSIAYPITIEDGKNTQSTLVFDLKKIFTQPNGGFYDIQANPATSSSLSKLDVALYIAEGFGRAGYME
jgi:hypothetical protein